MTRGGTATADSGGTLYPLPRSEVGFFYWVFFIEEVGEVRSMMVTERDYPHLRMEVRGLEPSLYDFTLRWDHSYLYVFFLGLGFINLGLGT